MLVFITATAVTRHLSAFAQWHQSLTLYLYDQVHIQYWNEIFVHDFPLHIFILNSTSRSSFARPQHILSKALSPSSPPARDLEMGNCISTWSCDHTEGTWLNKTCKRMLPEAGHLRYNQSSLDSVMGDGKILFWVLILIFALPMAWLVYVVLERSRRTRLTDSERGIIFRKLSRFRMHYWLPILMFCRYHHDSKLHD